MPEINNNKQFFSHIVEPDSKEMIVELQKLELLIEILPEVFHKLKNILTPILGYSQILKNKIGDGHLQNKFDKIEENANKLSDYLDILKNYYIYDKCLKQRENINKIINNLKPFFIGLKKTHNIQVKFNLDPKIPDDLLSFGQIENLIINITDNSIQAIAEKNTDIKNKNNLPEEGEIEIITLLEEDYYKLIIRDNGIGISEETINKIWTPFYSSFPKRTGIGLLLCERVIFNHDAEVKVRSREGYETEFEIKFQNKL